MRIELRNKYLSRPRYNRYLIATASNNDKAKKLYNANLRLAQSFHPILSQFEVVLRNSLNIVAKTPSLIPVEKAKPFAPCKPVRERIAFAGMIVWAAGSKETIKAVFYFRKVLPQMSFVLQNIPLLSVVIQGLLRYYSIIRHPYQLRYSASWIFSTCAFLLASDKDFPCSVQKPE